MNSGKKKKSRYFRLMIDGITNSAAFANVECVDGTCRYLSFAKANNPKAACHRFFNSNHSFGMTGGEEILHIVQNDVFLTACCEHRTILIITTSAGGGYA